MLESFRHISALFTKELNEMRRQPRLLLSLILGPFLILMLFGAGFESSRPELQTIIVYPRQPMSAEIVAEVRDAVNTNAIVVGETDNRQEALRQLRENEVDVVQALPPDLVSQLEYGDRATIEVFSNSINPQVEDWIEYLSFAEVSKINDRILHQVIVQTQTEAQRHSAQISELRENLSVINRNLNAVRRAELSGQVDAVRQSLYFLTVIAPRLETVPGDDPAQPLDQATLAALDQVEDMLANGELADGRQHIRTLIQRLDALHRELDIYANTDPEVLVSPVQFEHQSIRGYSYDLASYFLPAVLALLVQHIGVALGALTLVRERLSGAMGIFRVVPVSITEIIVGKYLAYLLTTSLVVAVLTTLLPLLNMSVDGRLLDLALLVLLLTLAALGIGFLISALSRTESQAVQLSLLVLLMSIFFGNFFLPLENFRRPIQIIGQMLPLTHGVAGLQEILLRHNSPEPTTLWALALIASITFLGMHTIVSLQNRRP